MGSDGIGAEQRRVDLLYTRLDALRSRTRADLGRARRMPTAGTPANRAEREALVAAHTARLAQLEAVEERLCFGRLDLRDAERRYIGRLGLSDDAQRQLLVDWRAPAAEPYYQATAAAPGDVVRRRHLTTSGRAVTAVEDEVLDPDALDPDDAATLSGDGALMAALTAHRTGRMRDIVATIQAEQDRVVRAPLSGVLVVQGGPGTGKTAVALHRAAYLLYTHRERLARSGVLLVGPSATFLRYIERVLPSLGETGVVMATPGTLLPGVTATGTEPAGVAALKGDPRMADAVRAAVRARQRVPDAPRRLQVDGTTVTLRPSDVAAARDRARRGGAPHNQARTVFVRDVLGRLARALAARRGVELEDRRADLLADLRDARDVRREVNLAWMPLTPEQVVADLWADPAGLAAAAPWLTDEQCRQLRRDRGAAWTAADVPLLDEAAELLGEAAAPAGPDAATAAQRQAELAAARRVLETSGAAGLLGAEALLERYGPQAERRSAAEHAAEDRTWAFGHVVVDEAQELSPMAWRMLMRRCPSRSMTVVGDIAQTGALAGARSWAEVLDPYADGRWRLEELTVNYRTPGRIMAVAGRLLAAHGVAARAPRSAREGEDPPLAQPRSGPEDVAAVVEAVRAELAVLDGGRLAVIGPAERRPELAAALGPVLPPERGDVLAVAEAKGLEYDSVVLVEPAEVLAASPRGANDLYVALTRPTRRLRVVHAGALPAGLEGLAPAPGEQPGAQPTEGLPWPSP